MRVQLINAEKDNSRPFRCEQSHWEHSLCIMKICIIHIFVNMNYANTFLPFELILLNRALLSAQLCWLFNGNTGELEKWAVWKLNSLLSNRFLNMHQEGIISLSQEKNTAQLYICNNQQNSLQTHDSKFYEHSYRNLVLCAKHQGDFGKLTQNSWMPV